VHSVQSGPPLLSDEHLEGLERHWRRQRMPIADRLRPGLSDDEIDELVGPLGLRLPNEPRRWWRWHDGAYAWGEGGPIWQVSMLPGRAFVPLRAAVEHCRMCRKIAREVEPDDPAILFPDFLFPITDVGNVACDCSVADEAPSPVWNTRAEFDVGPVARSFGEMVAWWLENFDAGHYRWDASRQTWADAPPPPHHQTRITLV
jgi:hypothetical protein